MHVLTLSSLADLKEYLSSVGERVLYRGQTKHFGGTESPAVISSFDRHGCIPYQMLKWSHYAHGALKFALGKSVDSIAMTQAVLQHYGWRSFFLDASASAHVGAWFAAHSYKQEINVHLSEDCFEDPMFLRKPQARYELEGGSGHFYLIDVEAALAAGVGVHDLASIEILDGRPRFVAQSAWLLGPQRGNLPIECFHSRVIAPREVFAEFAAEAGLIETPRLFPGPEEDVVLYSLLHLPWTEIDLGESAEGKEGSIPAFIRTVEIPEYHDGFTKIYGPGDAFYRGEMLADISPAGKESVPFTFHQVPEIVVFGTANPLASGFPNLVQALEAEPSIAFEIKQLVRFPETGVSSTYGKGLVVTRKEDGVISVGDLVIDHPGMVVAGAGSNFGWHYMVAEDDTWQRTKHPDDCPCGDDDRHLRHLSVLTILEHWLAAPEEFDAD